MLRHPFSRRRCYRDWYVCCSNGTWSKVVVTCFRRSCVLVVLHMRGMRRAGSRGCSGCSPEGHVDDESVVYRLSTWEVSIQGPRHGLFRPEHAFLLVSMWFDAEGEVWRIELAPERIGIFAQDHISHVVDQVIFVDGDQRSRGTRPLHPDLSRHHVAADRKQLFGIDTALVGG